MDIFNLFTNATGTDATATDATATDAGFDINVIFEAVLKVFGFFRQIIDFMKGIFTPMFESLLGSVLG